VSAAGHRLNPDHALKVETRVRTPLGLPGQTQVRGPFRLRRADLACSRPAFVPRRFSHYQYDRGITLREAARLQSSRRVRPSSAPGCTPDWERASAADGSRFFAMQIGRALGSAVAEMPFSEELVVGAITVLGKAGVSNFAAGVSLRRRGSEKPADEQGSCLAYGTPEQPRGCAFERMRRLGNRGQ
jgi:hypothetical protein